MKLHISLLAVILWKKRDCAEGISRTTKVGNFKETKESKEMQIR